MKQFSIYESLARLGHNLSLEKAILDVDGKKRVIDIAIEDFKIAIEYDGIYWHNSPESVIKDKQKSESLIASGWKVIRMRESTNKAYLPPLGIDSTDYCEMVCTYKAEGEAYDVDIKNLHGAIQRASIVREPRVVPDPNQSPITITSVNDFPAALSQCRINAGVMQLEAAKLAGINRTYLSRMETGEISLSYIERVLALLKIYGATLTISFDDEGGKRDTKN